MREKELQELRKAGEGVIQECRGLGGTLEAIAEVLDSCLTKEFVKAKFVSLFPLPFGLLMIPPVQDPFTPRLEPYNLISR